jgi:platelet-activating factor acetylhydrolase isoform II
MIQDFTVQSAFCSIAAMSSPHTPADSLSATGKSPFFAMRFIKRLVKSFAILALLGVLVVVTLFGLLRHEHGTETTLPSPTGRFAVGRTMFTWVNESQTDELAPSPETKRIVVAWIWYPSVVGSSAAPAEYLPAAWRTALEQHSGPLMSNFLTRDLALVRTHSTSDPDVSPEQRSYPVVILRAGGGALTTDFTTLAEDLASHGYFVAGFDAPYRSFVVVLPDGRVVSRPPSNDPENLSADEANRLINKLLPMWTGDTKFVVDRLEQLNAGDPSGKFAGRLDMQRLGMFGHSFGGATTLQFCHDDARCKAGIDIDGAPYGSVVQDGLKQPFMFLLSDHSRDVGDPDGRQILGNIRSIYDRLPRGRVFSTIRGANHFSFSDQMLVKSQYVIELMHLMGVSRLEGRRGLGITTEYVHTFFDVYLKGAPGDSLSKLAQQYPEVETGVPQ